MRLDEIKVDPLAGASLNTSSFKTIIKMIDKEIVGGNTAAIRVKNNILKRWKAGEKAAKKFKLDLDRLNISIKDVIK